MRKIRYLSLAKPSYLQSTADVQMKVGFDVAQTCGVKTGCAWHADALAHALAPLIGPENLLLYHHFGPWVNRSTRTGTFIPGCPSPLASLDYEEALELWPRIERGERELPGEPDLIHSNSFLAPKVDKVPYIYTVHDLCFLTHPEYTTERNIELCSRELEKAMRYATAFHFISESTRKDFEVQFPGFLESENKLYKVIHSGTRLKPQNLAHSIPTNESNWLFVGTIEPRKNIDAILDAFKLYWEHSSIKRPLRLVGSRGWNSDATYERIQDLERRKRVLYEGHIEDKRLQQLYQDSFALLFASHYEGFGLPVAEALSFGLPVISNEIGSVSEFASGYATLLDFTDSEKVASAMIRLEEDQDFYRSHSERSNDFETKYNWTKTGSQMLELYQDAIK